MKFQKKLLNEVIIFIKKILRFVIYKVIFYFRKFIVIANIYEHDLHLIKYNYKSRIEGEFKVINSEELESFKDQIPSQRFDLFKDRLNNLDTMLGFVSDGILTHWSWISYKRKYYEPVIYSFIEIPVESAFLFDDFTVTEYRRKGIHAASITERLKIIKDSGGKKALILILPRTKASLRNVENNFDFKLIRKIILINLSFFKFKFNIKRSYFF